VALEYATNPADLKLKMQGVGKGAIVNDETVRSNNDFFDFKDEEG